MVVIRFLWGVNFNSPGTSWPSSTSPESCTPYETVVSGYSSTAKSIYLSAQISSFTFWGRLWPSGIPAVIIFLGSGSGSGCCNPGTPTCKGVSTSPGFVLDGCTPDDCTPDGCALDNWWPGAGWLSADSAEDEGCGSLLDVSALVSLSIAAWCDIRVPCTDCIWPTSWSSNVVFMSAPGADAAPGDARPPARSWEACPTCMLPAHCWVTAAPATGLPSVSKPPARCWVTCMLSSISGVSLGPSCVSPLTLSACCRARKVGFRALLGRDATGGSPETGSLAAWRLREAICNQQYLWTVCVAK